MKPYNNSKENHDMTAQFIELDLGGRHVNLDHVRSVDVNGDPVLSGPLEAVFHLDDGTTVTTDRLGFYNLTASQWQFIPAQPGFTALTYATLQQPDQPDEEYIERKPVLAWVVKGGDLAGALALEGEAVGRLATVVGALDGGPVYEIGEGAWDSYERWLAGRREETTQNRAKKGNLPPSVLTT